LVGLIDLSSRVHRIHLVVLIVRSVKMNLWLHNAYLWAGLAYVMRIYLNLRICLGMWVDLEWGVDVGLSWLVRMALQVRMLVDGNDGCRVVLIASWIVLNGLVWLGVRELEELRRLAVTLVLVVML
jgi:hypothetical protein